jgi:hypothetical protein
MAQIIDHGCYIKLQNFFAKHKYYFRLTADKAAPMYQIIEKPVRGTMPEIVFNLYPMRNGDFNRCLDEVREKLNIKAKIK